MRENVDGAALLAEETARLKIPFMTFSSDLVFDGLLGRPYVESDTISPAGTYGESKAACERAVAQRNPNALIVRTSAFFGPWDEHNFLHFALSALRDGREFVAPDRVLVSPTYVPDLVEASLDLLLDGANGVWHLASAGSLSWYEFAVMAAKASGFDPAGIRADTAAAPRNTALASERGQLLPPLPDAVARFTGAWPRAQPKP